MFEGSVKGMIGRLPEADGGWGSESILSKKGDAADRMHWWTRKSMGENMTRCCRPPGPQRRIMSASGKSKRSADMVKRCQPKVGAVSL